MGVFSRVVFKDFFGKKLGASITFGRWEGRIYLRGSLTGENVFAGENYRIAVRALTFSFKLETGCAHFLTSAQKHTPLITLTSLKLSMIVASKISPLGSGLLTIDRTNDLLMNSN